MPQLGIDESSFKYVFEVRFFEVRFHSYSYVAVLWAVLWSMCTYLALALSAGYKYVQKYSSKANLSLLNLTSAIAWEG